MRTVLDNYSGCNRIIIGSDIPAIEQKHIQDAYTLLANHDLVFGPATDGGFWLVGCSADQLACEKTDERTDRVFMHDVRWSGSHALADTLKTLSPQKSVAKTYTLSDVDDLQAYQHYCRQSSVLTEQ